MNPITGIMAILGAISLLCLGAYEFGANRGYEQGRHDENEWLLKIESDIEAAREDLWREDLKR